MIVSILLREKGTNRSQFFRGQVAKYNWVDYGSSYLPSEINAAYLWAQLENADKINNNRLLTWNTYFSSLKSLEEKKLLELDKIPIECNHNAHMFFIKCKNIEQRTDFINFMRKNDIQCNFHYVPLHSAPAGLKFGIFYGKDIYTTSESDRLVRLPLYYGIKNNDVMLIIQKVKEFFLEQK